jgi:hypothetical protein
VASKKTGPLEGLTGTQRQDTVSGQLPSCLENDRLLAIAWCARIRRYPHDEMENHFGKEVVSPRTCRKNRINQKWQFSAPFELVCMLMRL